VGSARHLFPLYETHASKEREIENASSSSAALMFQFSAACSYACMCYPVTSLSHKVGFHGGFPVLGNAATHACHAWLERCEGQRLRSPIVAELCHHWLLLGRPRSMFTSRGNVHRCAPIADELWGRELESSRRSLGISRRERHRRRTVLIVSKRNRERMDICYSRSMMFSSATPIW
jgi:hypothetical protein